MTTPNKTSNNKSIVTLAVIFASVVAAVGLILLCLSKLSGAEFVSLVIASWVVALVIPQISRLEELTIGGNVLKLNRAKEEAKQAIDTLKPMIQASFKAQLNHLLLIAKPEKVELHQQSDHRIKPFLELVDLIKQQGFYEIMREDIKVVAKYLAAAQHQIMADSAPTPDHEMMLPKGFCKPEVFSDCSWLDDKLKSDYSKLISLLD
ncbi:hypothetical protein ACRTDM_00310 [Shewanella algae]|uniref:hypothetical protein n=1 Tax=Shewanella algae TaxID=38313 RepID=UPI000D128F16|nr:hypothetical protein [Shewanella algae]PSS68759.1 hypothetical protein AYI85_12875 [Shewanella algae]TVL05260.1 hypothetical protein AYI84_04510 [Shewanella algae]TVL53276.1 hypothetical protein AYI99_06755 [Shewanella algae]